ncbi:replication stress response regulator SDE2 [Ceratina calcarata]|uniref:Replication stress response regulator SDE2 n=1 Tax=Ceratina calcarata TaxID=156304 RepID=A0AAJ7JCG3_9HYME|nr:replication stress response regulator SDE2 [Ceratina calcarata]
MLTVQISTARGTKQIFTTNRQLKIDTLRDCIQGLIEDFYVVHNGRLVSADAICYDGYVSIVPRLFGGKGGFGSMLRAIGAQIEKTTNREACRDLSGRRLRDINEEKRLKAWIEKQGKREEEAVERKKKKLERLCAEPKHEFKDQTYERERSALTERLGDAVEQGFKFASTDTKRKRGSSSEQQFRPNKKKLLLDLDINSDEFDTSDESDEDEKKCEESGKSIDVEPVSNNDDSGHSSDGSRGSVQKTETEVERPKGNADDESTKKDSNVSMDEKTVSV